MTSEKEKMAGIVQGILKSPGSDKSLIFADPSKIKIKGINTKYEVIQNDDRELFERDLNLAIATGSVYIQGTFQVNNLMNIDAVGTVSKSDSKLVYTAMVITDVEED